MLQSRHPRAAIVVSVLSAGLCAAPLVAGGGSSWTLGVDPASSTTEGSGTVSSDLAGFLIGDFDAATNPDGTLTLPGLFGGNGNQPVDLELDLVIGGFFAGGVGGGFRVVGDPASGSIGVEDLQLDLLSGADPALPLSVTIVFETFRTFNPDSLFPGGIPVEVPLGEATLVGLQAIQVGPAMLTAVPAGKGSFTLTGGVPVLLAAEVNALGQVLPLPPIPVVLPLEESQITITGDGSAMVNLAFAFAISQEDDGPFTEPVLDGVPFELPTVLPPGEIASVLFTATPELVSTGITLLVALEASGPLDEPSVPGDVNGDQAVDFADVLAVLSNFGPCADGAPCPADLTDDLVVDFGDLLVVLANWTA